MNIEQETKDVLRTNFTIENKIKIINTFTNFKDKDIMETITKTDTSRADLLYGELLKRDENGKRN